MATTKHQREKKRQLGQFLTPPEIAEGILSRLPLRATDRVLEPGFGAGAFLLPLIGRFMELRGDLEAVLAENVWGVELDPKLHAKTLEEIRRRWGPLPRRHHLHRGDFLRDEELEAASFDLVVGNPPFGGTVDLRHQDQLEARYGTRHGLKIKKETYAYFIVKALDLVRPGGRIEFISSDTFLTIPTMRGLRKALMDEGACEVERLDGFSSETAYPMVVLRFVRGRPGPAVKVDGREVPCEEIARTANFSWRAGGEFAPYFGGPVLGDYFVASSGMTTGRNEYFVREISDGAIEEPFRFEFFEEPITVGGELERARLRRLAPRTIAALREREARGETRRNVRVVPLPSPKRVRLPHPHYRFYNKAQAGLVYAPPRYAIFWKDDGDAVLTFKRSGNWYLRGVGGAPFFGREGLTWRLISTRLDVRYLPPGYILDSGAPCAFLREGVAREELWFVLGWTLSATATRILKGVLNHTRNIQSKDFERLPYPAWVPPARKREIVATVRRLVERATEGTPVDRDHPELAGLDALFALPRARRTRRVA